MTRTKLFYLISMSLAFVLRLFFALQDRVYTIDMNCFQAWGAAIETYGFSGIYHSDIFLDYPPGYLYVLAVLHKVKMLFSLPYRHPLTYCLFKLPAILADLATSAFLYRIAREKKGEIWGLAIASVYAFCPAVFYTSSIWGQVDSIFTLLLLLTLYALYKGKIKTAALLYALTLLVKTQALIFGPILLFAMIERKSLKDTVKAVALGLATVWILTLPFAGSLWPGWLVKLYLNNMGGYPFFTVNGYNLYALLGLNWVELSANAFAHLINPVVLLIAFVFTGWAFFRNREKTKIFSAAIGFHLLIFSFCTMMHERYLFPVLALALLTFILTDKKTYLLIFFVTGISCFINISASFRTQMEAWPVPVPVYVFASLLTIAACALSIFSFTKEGQLDIMSI